VITSQVAGILTLHLPGRDFYSLLQLLEHVKHCSMRSYDHEGVGLKGDCGMSWPRDLRDVWGIRSASHYTDYTWLKGLNSHVFRALNLKEKPRQSVMAGW